MPDDGDLMDLLARLGAERSGPATKILVDNPAALYGF